MFGETSSAWWLHKSFDLCAEICLLPAEHVVHNARLHNNRRLQHKEAPVRPLLNEHHRVLQLRRLQRCRNSPARASRDFTARARRRSRTASAYLMRVVSSRLACSLHLIPVILFNHSFFNLYVRSSLNNSTLNVRVDLHISNTCLTFHGAFEPFNHYL